VFVLLTHTAHLNKNSVFCFGVGNLAKLEMIGYNQR